MSHEPTTGLRRLRPILLLAAVMMAVTATAALAAGAIDTTGLPLSGHGGLTRYSPSDFDNAGSTLAQTFVAPADATKVTAISARISVGATDNGPNPRAQAAELTLRRLTGEGVPADPIATTDIVLDLGSSATLRRFPVDWTVTGGQRYAIAIRVPTSDVTAEVDWRIPTGRDGAYPGGGAYTGDERGLSFSAMPEADLSFRIDFTPADSSGGTGGDGTSRGGTDSGTTGGGTTGGSSGTTTAGTGGQGGGATSGSTSRGSAPAFATADILLKASAPKSGKPRVSVSCPATASGSCRAQLVLRAARGRTILAKGSATIVAGTSASVALKLTRAGRRAARGKRSLKGSLTVSIADRAGTTAARTSRLAVKLKP